MLAVGDTLPYTGQKQPGYSGVCICERHIPRVRYSPVVYKRPAPVFGRRVAAHTVLSGSGGIPCGNDHPRYKKKKEARNFGELFKISADRKRSRIFMVYDRSRDQLLQV